MKKKTRLTILLVCIACFLVIAPVLVLYSMGYRFDFANMRITATGGIYVRTFPTAEKIIIDSKISGKPNMFANSIFVQSLLPGNHTVLIEKNAYYNYSKTLPVQENQVTKLENVLLIKKNILFEVVTDKTQSPFSTKLSEPQKTIPILKGLLAQATVDNNIIWLSSDGFLYKADLAGIATLTQKTAVKITSEPLKIISKGFYKIIANSQNIFVIDNGNLLFVNTKTNILDKFYAPVSDAIISPDGKNIIYFNDSNIYISLLTEPVKKNALYKSSEKITDCQWLNNDYIVFTSGDKIIISEIDYRGNINSVTLPLAITILPEKQIDIKNPKIFLDQQNSKLYILTNNTLLLSEKLVP